MKIVVNKCFGGFGLSYEAVMLYAKLKKMKLYAFTDFRDTQGKLDFNKKIPYNGTGNKPFVVHYCTAPLKKGKLDSQKYFSDRDIARDDPILVKVVEKLGDKASGTVAKLRVIEIPDGVQWEIDDYDGNETISEIHRSW
jgi:hypothetical protein